MAAQRSDDGDDLPGPVHDVVQGIVDGVAPRRVVLFGSHAAGSGGPDSDVDLLVVLDHVEDPIEDCLRVKRAARKARRGVPLDILVFSAAEFQERTRRGDVILRTILSEGREVYARAG